MIALTEQSLHVPHLPKELSGLRVVHLTDFHRGTTTQDALIREAVTQANRLCPDVILMTGDYVNHDPKDIEPCAEMLSSLKAGAGVYFILGNHDYVTAGDAMATALKQCGFVSLINRSICIAGGLYLAGIDDDRAGKPDVHAAIDSVPESSPLLALVHNPVVAERFASRECIAFAGHTHGGQINLPIIRDFALWKIGAKRYRAGWYSLDKTRLYVNRGIGNTGVRFRIHTPPEIALFTLTSDPPHGHSIGNPDRSLYPST